MARLRYNNQGGKLGTGLNATSGSQAIVGLFAVAPSFATLTAGQYIVLCIGGDTITYEIVHLTAYTAGSKNGTILRAQEGTTAKAHAATRVWGNDPTVQDFTTVTATTETITGAATFHSGLSAGTHRITNVATPTMATNGATKGYADSIAAGLSPKTAVVAVATTNIVTLKGHPTIDTVVTGTTTRVLLTGQTTKKKNGIWLTKTGATTAWTRPMTFATGSTQQGSSVFVETGTAPNKGSGWVMVGAAIVVTTGTQTWTRNTPAGVYIPLTQKGAATGVATLNATDHLPTAQAPSRVAYATTSKKIGGVAVTGPSSNSAVLMGENGTTAHWSFTYISNVSIIYPQSTFLQHTGTTVLFYNRGIGTVEVVGATTAPTAGHMLVTTPPLATNYGQARWQPVATIAVGHAATATDLGGVAAATYATKTFATGLVATERTRAETAEATKVTKATDLSTLPTKSAARTNLGLGSAATQPSSAFDAAGSAATAQANAEAFATTKVATERTRAIAAEATKVTKATNLSTLPTEGAARTHLGLGTAATHNSTFFIAATARGAATGVAELDATTKVPLTELHTIPLTKGGTGATTAAAARTALGLGTAAVDNATAFDTAGAAAAAQAAAEAASIPLAQKAAHTGVATLGNTGKVPTTQLPTLHTGTVTSVAAPTSTLTIATATTAAKLKFATSKLKVKVLQLVTRILAAVSAGTISIRPNGPTSTSGQVQITTAGVVKLASGGGINSGSSVVYATHTIVSGTAYTPTATRDCVVQWSTSSGTGTVKVTVGGHTLTTGARTYNGGLLSGFFSSNWNYFVPAGESITITKTGGLAFTKMWIQKGV